MKPGHTHCSAQVPDNSLWPASRGTTREVLSKTKLNFIENRETQLLFDFLSPTSSRLQTGAEKSSLKRGFQPRYPHSKLIGQSSAILGRGNNDEADHGYNDFRSAQISTLYSAQFTAPHSQPIQLSHPTARVTTDHASYRPLSRISSSASHQIALIDTDQLSSDLKPRQLSQKEDHRYNSQKKYSPCAHDVLEKKIWRRIARPAENSRVYMIETMEMYKSEFGA
ncbi:hypothetical protein F511_37013 [Dorcoceras hygrometricum]|uniref:Uncharacterized protein n=1 Tax=Dorcoceras hygrometricum TaxID=472368 RepID=A0A2Z7A840_9LAMI|nr:hypothetical protein F511_37013 [Dorcoceras hygrometricum]